MDEIYAVLRIGSSCGIGIVTSYTTREQADLHCSKAMEWRFTNRSVVDISNHAGSHPPVNPYDPNFKEHEAYVCYIVNPLSYPFRHLDEFLEANGQ